MGAVEKGRAVWRQGRCNSSPVEEEVRIDQSTLISGSAYTSQLRAQVVLGRQGDAGNREEKWKAGGGFVFNRGGNVIVVVVVVVMMRRREQRGPRFLEL